MKLKNFANLEWDAIAGIIAAVVAIVLHLLHIVDEHVILPIVLALIGLLFINFMRHTANNEQTAEEVERIAGTVNKIETAIKHPDVVLVGPRNLRLVNEQFIRVMSGETIWFNVCLSMYRSQPLFDVLLRPALDNPMVTSIQFVLDNSQRELWQQQIYSRIAACPGHLKVKEPLWHELDKTISYILADSQLSGGSEALLSFWGEPFMAQTTERDVPRYIFHVQRHSELLPHLEEMVRALPKH
ncbi:MAG: hypothetical protein M0Q95_13785 [Porticoccaceae bacterium]|nr:hypothetical protein [Porticoccaceae bacterium]